METTKIIDIGTGAYMPSEVAFILGISNDKITRWMKNYFTEKIVRIDKRMFLNFYSMIEIYVFNTLIENGVKRQYVKNLYEWMQKDLNLDYPFATQELFFLNRQVFIKRNNMLIDGQISGVIKEIVNPFLQKISFSPDGVALHYYPLGKDSTIIVNPEIQFGKPILKNTRITAESIYDMILAGENDDDIKFYFDISQQNIDDVKKLFKYTA